jgi:hypothetical protein
MFEMKNAPVSFPTSDRELGGVIRGIPRLIRLSIVFAAMFFAVKPTWGQQMDPVKGPMALQAPGPFWEGTRGGGTYSYVIKSDFGRVKQFSYADGERLKGKPDWTIASAADATAAENADTGQPSLAAAWDLVYGAGYYAAHIAGNKILQGTFTGDKGTVLRVQSLDHFIAVGADNHGNLYKIVW